MRESQHVATRFAGFEKFFTTLRAAFPDLTITPEHVVTDEDNVSFAHSGHFPQWDVPEDAARLILACTG